MKSNKMATLVAVSSEINQKHFLARSASPKRYKHSNENGLSLFPKKNGTLFSNEIILKHVCVSGKQIEFTQTTTKQNFVIT